MIVAVGVKVVNPNVIVFRIYAVAPGFVVVAFRFEDPVSHIWLGVAEGVTTGNTELTVVVNVVLQPVLSV